MMEKSNKLLDNLNKEYKKQEQLRKSSIGMEEYKVHNALYHMLGRILNGSDK